MNRQISTLLHSKWLQWGLLALAVMTMMIPFVCTMFKGGVFCDSAYYICMAERLTEGYVPYKTLDLGYTPLFIYMMAGLKLLLGIPGGCYVPYLLFYYLLAFGLAFLVYGIAREFGSGRMVALLGGWMSFMMIYWLDGSWVALEVPSLFFGLASTFCLLHFRERNIWNYLWIGALTACAFLCKQYGLGFIGINLLALLTINRQSWKECGVLLLGFALPIMLCLALWGGDFVSGISNGYGSSSAAGAGNCAWNSFKSCITAAFRFGYTTCAAVFVGLLCFPQARKDGHLWKLLLGYCGILGFSLQFIFNYSIHYMIYMAPFASLVVTEMLTIRDKRWLQGIKYLAVLYTAGLLLYNVLRINNYYFQKDYRSAQTSLTRQVEQYVSPGDILWTPDPALFHLLFTTRVLPPNVSTTGYSFGPLGINEEEAFRQCMDAEWIVRYSGDDEWAPYFTDSLRRYVEQYTLVAQFQDSTILLYRNPNR